MKEVCIPIPHFGDNQIAEVEVTVNGKKEKFNFRVESFPWELPLDETSAIDILNGSKIKVENLRKMINEYDSRWEIVQIYTPSENSKNIQILFRQRENG